MEEFKRAIDTLPRSTWTAEDPQSRLIRRQLKILELMEDGSCCPPGISPFDTDTVDPNDPFAGDGMAWDIGLAGGYWCKQDPPFCTQNEMWCPQKHWRFCSPWVKVTFGWTGVNTEMICKCVKYEEMLLMLALVLVFAWLLPGAVIVALRLILRKAAEAGAVKP